MQFLGNFLCQHNSTFFLNFISNLFSTFFAKHLDRNPDPVQVTHVAGQLETNPGHPPQPKKPRP